MITLEGSRTLPQSPDAVYERIGNAEFLSTCLGPLISCEATPDSAAFKAKPALGIVSGTVDGMLSILERLPPDRLRIEQRMRGSGFTARVEIFVAIAANGPGTAIAWKAEVREATGLLRMVPNGMMRSAAQKAVGEIWADVEAKMP